MRVPFPLTSMLYFQMVIMAGTVMLAYYFEYTDTFAVNVQGFFCYEGAYRKPYPGPEDRSAVPPVLLYSLTAGVPVLVIIVGETAVFCLQLATKDFENQEKTILSGDCCYINPLVRRTIRFLGIYAFGLFATDIFVNAGQVVTGNLAPHFLALCKPNYTALGCKQYTQFISSIHACTGNPDLIMKARKTFPSKEAALSVYAAMYLAMYITNTVKARGTRLAKPVLCLGLMCLAFLTGINRVAEYRNHWSDVIAGFIIGISIAVFLVVCVVNNFRGRQPEHEHSHMDNLAQMPMISIPRVESPLEKFFVRLREVSTAVTLDTMLLLFIYCLLTCLPCIFKKHRKGSRELYERLRPATGIPNDWNYKFLPWCSHNVMWTGRLCSISLPGYVV
ncbi:phospholipid phosphatase-related protein type 5 isoform X4 [Harpia harpyja]|uniref:phospholipid phosphatase-related protein type 5 isoform X4 n=1 Tax=Harpia harpyja TaxID=202280 RepID=UPI0022B08F6B|nr:phospholipid phosphatase-related protein type 5 isoform X4 [Harpia harpyja]